MLTAAHLGIAPHEFAIASLFGIGDTCLVAGHMKVFSNTHQQPVVLAVRQGHQEVAAMFPGVSRTVIVPEYEIAPLTNTVTVGVPQPGHLFVAHPSTVPARLDHCVAHGRMSDAAMYALILGLPPQSRLALPAIPPDKRELAQAIASAHAIAPGRTVVLVPRANSWPPIDNHFWDLLQARLASNGWHVWVNDPGNLPLPCALPFLEIAGWVIGANCGFMQMAVQSGIHCRKTILSRALYPDELHGERHPLPITRVWPDYSMFRKVDGCQYDIEEFRVDGPTSWPGAIAAVTQGRNAQGPVPDPGPLLFMDVQISPGELCDRLSIMEIKQARLPSKAQYLATEVTRLTPLREHLLRAHPEIVAFAQELRNLNEQAWTLNEVLIGDYQRGVGGPGWQVVEDSTVDGLSRVERHVRAAYEAHHCNRRRVEVRNDIDAHCRAGHVEVKSYR